MDYDKKELLKEPILNATLSRLKKAQYQFDEISIDIYSIVESLKPITESNEKSCEPVCDDSNGMINDFINEIQKIEYCNSRLLKISNHLKTLIGT